MIDKQDLMVDQQELLKTTIHDLKFGIPNEVFQFQFNRKSGRKDAEAHLKKHPNVPFILRLSMEPGYFALDIYDADIGTYRHALILPPKPNEKKFITGVFKESVFIAGADLVEYLQEYWDYDLKRILSDNEQIKRKNESKQNEPHQQQRQDHKIAVLSIQSLDEKKIALAPEELSTYAQQNPGVQRCGDGHTGFAMALALNAPFVVVRSGCNRKESTDVLQPYIGDNGLILVTGHGRPGGDEIQGHYDFLNLMALEVSAEQKAYNNQIERGPGDIVSTTQDAGLKGGHHITIVLCICYGAENTNAKVNDSFAHKLALEFAKQGISSTIIASDKAVLRFGTNAIVDEKITFTEQAGIAAEDVYVFTTKVDCPNSNPEISIHKPNQAIQLTKNGVVFLNPNDPIIASTSNALKKQSKQHVQKPTEQPPRVRKKDIVLFSLEPSTQQESEASENNLKNKPF